MTSCHCCMIIDFCSVEHCTLAYDSSAAAEDYDNKVFPAVAFFKVRSLRISILLSMEWLLC